MGAAFTSELVRRTAVAANKLWSSALTSNYFLIRDYYLSASGQRSAIETKLVRFGLLLVTAYNHTRVVDFIPSTLRNIFGNFLAAAV